MVHLVGKVAIGAWILVAGFLLVVEVRAWYVWRGQVTAAVNGLLSQSATKESK